MLALTEYLQAGFFLGLAALLWRAWMERHGRRVLHLAPAAALFGAANLIAGIESSVHLDPTGAPARALFIVSGTLLFSSMFAFALFINDYQPLAIELRVLISLVTIANVALLVIERPEPAGAESQDLIAYSRFVQYTRVYLIVGFALLALGFLRNAVRGFGLQRARMLCLTIGFIALSLAGGLSSGHVRSHAASQNIHALAMALRAIALIAAPALYLGLMPPAPVARLFNEERGIATQN